MDARPDDPANALNPMPKWAEFVVFVGLSLLIGLVVVTLALVGDGPLTR